jgi:hypothetical protein
MVQKRPLIMFYFVGGTILLIVLFLLYGTVMQTSADSVTPNFIFEERKTLAFDTAVMDAENYNCRYGATLNGNDQAIYLDDLKMGWYGNFAVNFLETVSPNIEYVPTIRLKQARDETTGSRLPDYIVSPPLTDEANGLGTSVQQHPGRMWLVGNEVDRIAWQDDVMPDVYAMAYHDIYHFIKDRDPSAQIAISGLVQVTPGRLQYLDIVWNTYLDLYGTSMPVDVWNMHVYILPEAKLENGVRVPSSLAHIALGTDINLAKLESGGMPSQCANNDVYCFAEHDDLDIFAQQVVAMRQWMKAHGQQQKPLIITEYSQLYPYIPEGNGCFLMDEWGNCFTKTRVTQFMQGTLAYLENSKDPALGYHVDDDRLVQRWLWYTIYNHEQGAPSNLVYLNDDQGNEDGTLTLMGTAYQQAAGSNLVVNLVPEDDNISMVAQNTDTAAIHVSIMNNGTIPVSVPFTVTFYADEAMIQEIGSYEIDGEINGCVRNALEASVNWSGLTPGLNRYWGLIDSGSDVENENKSDNVFTGFVLVDPDQVFLPTVHR